MFREIPDALLKEVYASESFARSAQGKQALDRCGAEICVVSDEVFQAISDTRTPQGILALASFITGRRTCWEELQDRPRRMESLSL